MADGCYIAKGARLENSVIGLRSVIGENTLIKDSVILGVDEFAASSHKNGEPSIGIGANTIIDGAIVDKNCRIGSDVVIRRPEGRSEYEGDFYAIRDGIPVFEKNAVVPDGWRLPD